MKTTKTDLQKTLEAAVELLIQGKCKKAESLFSGLSFPRIRDMSNEEILLTRQYLRIKRG